MLGNEEQVNHWRSLVAETRIVGAYAQTEVGHGSNVQGLETTAVFQNGEFILNSPKSSAFKFWPGLLGIYCTHVVLQA